MKAVRFQQLTDMTDLVQCTAIEHSVWNEGIVPTHLLKAVATTGGLAVGAFGPDGLVGFTFGFLGRRDNELLHHSHVLAVLPKWRGLGIGEGLKRKQAILCRQQGLNLMTWTFDPLRARNAHLNLEKLGANVRIYEASYYGDMSDAENGLLDSDRLLAEWHLLERPPRWRGSVERLPRALTASPSADGPGEPDLSLDARAVHVAVPADIGQLLEQDPQQAVAWRQAVREAMSHYLTRDYVATRFLGGGYVLERG